MEIHVYTHLSTNSVLEPSIVDSPARLGAKSLAIFFVPPPTVREPSRQLFVEEHPSALLPSPAARYEPFHCQIIILVPGLVASACHGSDTMCLVMHEQGASTVRRLACTRAVNYFTLGY